jgi:hypothetical protein
MKVEIKKIGESIYHLEFANQRKMAKTFVRFQEHFESPKYRGKVFTFKEFKKWYKKKNKGKFSYPDDYVGFNIPSAVLRPFYEGKFDPLSEKEKWLLEQFKQTAGRFYIIGTFKEKSKKSAEQTFRHELAHALYYTNEAYQQEVNDVLKSVDLTKLNKAFAKEADYHESVFLDECHAYILCDLKWMKKTWKVNPKRYEETHKKLEKVFEKYHAS